MSLRWTSPSGRQSVISPRGELDLATAPKVLAAVEDAITDARTEAIVIDLSSVTFMDSSGVKCVVAAANALRERDGHVAVCNASAPIARLLTMLGIDRTVDLFTTPDPVPAPATNPL